MYGRAHLYVQCIEKLRQEDHEVKVSLHEKGEKGCRHVMLSTID